MFDTYKTPIEEQLTSILEEEGVQAAKLDRKSVV
jgi:hypothetical protein